MTINEIEAACEASRPIDFRRHPLEPPALTLQEMFYPLGFPVLLRSNSPDVMDLYRKAWLGFSQRYDTVPVPVDVHVLPGTGTECPPPPVFHMTLPTMLGVADTSNFCLFDLERGCTQIVLSSAAMEHPLYATYFFLESAAACRICTQFATAMHAACVEWNGRGILLCGDSGAGKSTLSYACARAGFGYISDDATLLLHGREERVVTGNSRKVRLRPEGSSLFPEICDLGVTPRAAGKPSVEFALSRGIASLDETRIEHIVFLNRRSGKTVLEPYPKDVARAFLRQSVYGLPHQLAAHYDNIERVLQADVHELHYTGLDWAIDRLRTLGKEDR